MSVLTSILWWLVLSKGFEETEEEQTNVPNPVYSQDSGIHVAGEGHILAKTTG